MVSNTRRSLNFELYKKLYLIRRAEEKIIEHYPENEMKTPMHMSLGQEAIAAGVCHALREGNHQALCSYRSHAVYLAMTEETDQFFGELYGKATGMARGRAGSMHLSHPEKGFLGASAIVASTNPVSTGAAFANKVFKNGRVVAVFFGDGAVDEGAFWESLNLACVMKLPVLFVCEDNGFAVNTPTNQRQGYESLSEIVRKFHCFVCKESTTDTSIIYNLAQSAIDRILKNGRPAFMYLRYYRYLQHVGVNYDFEGFRSRAEYEVWRKVDPINMQRKKLLRMGISKKEIKETERKIDDQVVLSVARAKKAPFPEHQDLFERSL